ncbi:MAG: oxidoreductase [Lentisphaerae bacterium]|nr:oxidoreductase [Lentisphaerota bacterium]
MKAMTMMAVGAAAAGLAACGTMGTGGGGTVKLLTLDPGHFHAALVQKSMTPGVDPVVHVYAPAGEEVEAHLARIKSFNERAEKPTAWKTEVYRGPDYLERMLAEKKGNVMVTSGNNRRKLEYIKSAVDAGLNVLADKPMAINAKGFATLLEAYASAEKNKVLLYDIMTERYEITTMLQKEFSLIPAVFGQMEKGTPQNPAVTKESIHHFSKIVSGSPLVRPAWFFDVEQQGEGIVDVTTHLVDLIQWECFPEVVLDHTKDIEIVTAKRWPTVISPEQFKGVTKKDPWPDYLKKDVKDGALNVFANGEIVYRLRGVCAKVSVVWNFEAPAGAGDTHYSILRGSKANLVIRQGKEQAFKPTLCVEPVAGVDAGAFEQALAASLPKITAKYPGVGLKRIDKGWEILIPDSYRDGHEAHFAQVADKYFRFLRDGKLPAWEVPNTIAKYYTTTKAREIALQAK